MKATDLVTWALAGCVLSVSAASANALTFFGFDTGLHERCAWTPAPTNNKFFSDTTDCPGANYGTSPPPPHWSLCANREGCSGPDCQTSKINGGSGNPIHLGYVPNCDSCGCNGAASHVFFSFEGTNTLGDFPTIVNFHSLHQIAMIAHSGEHAIQINLPMFWLNSSGILVRHVIILVIRPYLFWSAGPGDQYPNDPIIAHISNEPNANAVYVDASEWGFDALCPNESCGAWHSYSIDWGALFAHIQNKGIWTDAPPITQIVPGSVNMAVETFDGGSIHFQHRGFATFSQ